MSLTITDRPMDCCAVVEANGFTCGHEEDVEASLVKYFEAIEKHQRDTSRNLAIITLADGQKPAMKLAEERGWKCTQTFFNPNSGNKVYVYTRVVWESRTEWLNEWNKGYRPSSRYPGTDKKDVYTVEAVAKAPPTPEETAFALDQQLKLAQSWAAYQARRAATRYTSTVVSVSGASNAL